jgi:ABC-2 type transport system ATP-binding protein
MGQKLQFVTTVLHEPKLIILDEPFSGLDPVNSNLIKEEIFNLAQKGSTIIFSTHRMEQVEEICNQIILLNKGTKILDGGVSEVKQKYKENLFHIGFEEMPSQLNSPAFEIVRRERKALVVKINERFRINDVLHYFLDQQVNLTEFHEMLPTLNDIFIRLVEGTSVSRQFQNLNA